MPVYTVRRRVSYYEEVRVEANTIESALTNVAAETDWIDSEIVDENIESMVVVCACGAPALEDGRCDTCFAPDGSENKP